MSAIGRGASVVADPAQKLILAGIAAIVSGWSALPVLATNKSANRPNVVLVMTDDQGYGDLSTDGNSWIRTPHLDALASQSIRFDDYHASPYCVPTRASLLTGRYADRTGIHNVLEPHWFVRTDEVMLSRMFQDAGYATGMFGKWHLGDNYPYGSEHRGFDKVLRHYGGAIGVLSDYWDNAYVDDTYYHNSVPTRVEGYCTDVFFAAATRFISKSAKQGRPFFVYLAANAPHGPFVSPPAYTKPYQRINAENITDFYGMIANVDENVGKLRAFLTDEGLENSTIFIFTTDNGTGIGDSIYNAGMRGKKGSAYDGGHRVPLFIYWPDGGFSEERRVQTLTSHIDVTPTLLDLCNIPRPGDVKFDGVSLRPLLEKGDHKSWRDRIIMTDAQSSGPPRKWVQTAVLSEHWRLVGGTELYDIDADPGQARNVRDDHAQVVARLSAWYDALWDDLEPMFGDVAEIPLGDKSAEAVVLNYHDCIGRHKFWFQSDVRSISNWIDQPDSRRHPAFWPICVVSAGEYTIELRRWPVEANTAIRANLPAGDRVYGRRAHRTTPGIGFPAVEARLTIGEQAVVQDVNTSAAGVTFRVKLSKGSRRLSTRFVDAQARSLDVFYVYITRTV